MSETKKGRLGFLRLFSRRDIWLIPLAYILFGIFLTLYQYKLIYHPDNTPPHTCNTNGILMNTDDDSIRGYYFPNSSKETDTLVVLYHGNAGNACHRQFYTKPIHSANHSLLIVEYPGFAEPDTPRTQNILNYTHNVAKQISKLGYEKFILIGESIGSGFASYHATHQTPEHLILITPFAKLSDVTQSVIPIYPTRLLLRSDLKVHEWAKSAPRKTIIAAENDEVIPIHHAKKLHRKLDILDESLIIILNTSHNTISTSNKFYTYLTESLSK